MNKGSLLAVIANHNILLYEVYEMLKLSDDKLAQCDNIRKATRKAAAYYSQTLERSELANWFGRKFNNLEIAYTCNLTTNIALVVQEGYWCIGRQDG